MSSVREKFFFAIVITLWTLFHVYVGFRLLTPLAIRPDYRRLIWATLFALMGISLFGFLSGRMLTKPAWFTPVIWIGYVWMGLLLVAMPLTLLRDIVAVAGLLASKLTSSAQAADSTHLVSAGRRHFLLNLTSALISIATLGLGTFGFFAARKRANLVHVAVPCANLPKALDGFRIVQLSDLHIGPTIRGSHLKAIVQAVNEIGADLVAITGDLIDGYVHELDNHVRPLADLRSKHGTYVVTGNHEYYWDAEAWVDYLRSLGLTVLQNEHRRVEHNNASFILAGVPDISANGMTAAQTSNPHQAGHGTSSSDFRVLLAHQPRSLFEAQKAGFDLQLSGHTHGGQFFPWNILVRLVQPVSAGLHRLGSMWIYVSRGTGYWGPPLRIGAPSEITVLTLRTTGPQRTL